MVGIYNDTFSLFKIVLVSVCFLFLLSSRWWRDIRTRHFFKLVYCRNCVSLLLLTNPCTHLYTTHMPCLVLLLTPCTPSYLLKIRKIVHTMSLLMLTVLIGKWWPPSPLHGRSPHQIVKTFFGLVTVSKDRKFPNQTTELIMLYPILILLRNVNIRNFFMHNFLTIYCFTPYQSIYLL